jgi:serine/threonine protein kinase
MSRFKEKFIKEAQTIAALDHPNIIHILDIFEENNTAYYVMEYIEGGSLSDVVKRCGALDEAIAVTYIRHIADALDYIHEQKINHLDVKPGNIMVRTKDDNAILIDFGLAKHYDDGGDQTSSTPVGISHGYAPFEQYKSGGVSSFSPATDTRYVTSRLWTPPEEPPSLTHISQASAHPRLSFSLTTW